jgi:predicted enzyme related to lactoylglutathione lyase
MQADAVLQGKFVWFEHQSDDPEKAQAFYEPLFGWQVQPAPMNGGPYRMIQSGDTGIGGLVTGTKGQRARWRSYVSAEDVDATYATAVAAGARAVTPPTDYPPMGRGATIVDPTGAELSLWRSDRAVRADAEHVPPGEWYWNELWTVDAKAAVAFYEQVLGYAHEEMNMGEHGTYYVLKSQGRARGGVFQSPNERTPSIWMPYVHVVDCDATAARAERQGATIFMPPIDVAGVGRFGAMFDPQGAAVAFIKGMPAAAA